LRIIVQKFGGTSLATPEGRQQAVRRVEQAVRDGLSPVVVVSAMGREGSPYATDTLIQLANEVCTTLAPREMDLLLSCGEIISSVIMVAALTAAGLEAVALTGGQAGIVTDEQFGAAHIRGVDPTPVLERLRQGKVAVVAGFQGVTPSGEVTTLGRGGCDTTAAALGGALRAEVVEIYTDVDGVKTADPRLVPDARTLRVSTYDEIAQMAHFGAKVIHPRAVEIAMQLRVPLRIRSTFESGPGTLVTYSREAAGAGWSELGHGGPVTAVTHVADLAQVVVAGGRSDSALPVFRGLADAAISVDLINLSPGGQSFCVAESKAEQTEALLRAMGLEPEIRRGCAKVSVVGSGMRGRPGVMATVVAALTAAGIPILQTADSHVTISCLVDSRHLRQAVQALHSAFMLGEKESAEREL